MTNFKRYALTLIAALAMSAAPFAVATTNAVAGPVGGVVQSVKSVASPHGDGRYWTAVRVPVAYGRQFTRIPVAFGRQLTRLPVAYGRQFTRIPRASR